MEIKCFFHVLQKTGYTTCRHKHDNSIQAGKQKKRQTSCYEIFYFKGNDWQWSYWQKKSETKTNHNSHLAEQQRMWLKTEPLIKCLVWRLRFCLFWLTFTSQAHLMLQHVQEIRAHSELCMCGHVICKTDCGKMKEGENGDKITRKWNGSFWVVKFQTECKMGL